MSSSPVPVNRQIVLASRPTGGLTSSHFAIVDEAIAEPAPGQLLVRNILLSIDPANRAWMQAATYRDRLEAGQVIDAFTLGEVIGQRNTNVAIGAVVECLHGGWQEYAVVDAEEVRVIDVVAPLQHHMGCLGITGLTAYFGLDRIAKVKCGETLVVSAAAGATGHIVGQLAKLAGARVVGITGSDNKNRFLCEKLGFDAAVNHHSADLKAELDAACPSGIDVYFDNVGGPLLETILRHMNVAGRVACCGVVSQYDTDSPAPGPRGVPGLLITKRLRMEGFLLTDYHDEWHAASSVLADHVTAGRITPVEAPVDGLQHAPQALLDLLAGRNLGKVMVRVADDPKPTGGQT